MKSSFRLILLVNILILSKEIPNAQAQDVQPDSSLTEPSTLPHRRFYSGIGGHYGAMQAIPTNNVATVASTYMGFTTYDDQELSTSIFFYGVYFDFLEYYFNERFSLNLSSLNGWSGTPHSDISGLNQSEKTSFFTSALMINYNFRVYHNPDNLPKNSINYGNSYNYIGIGPTLIQVTDMQASVTLNTGVKREVSAAYSSVMGIAFQIGAKRVNNGQVNIACRLGIPFGNMRVDRLSVKEDGVPVSADKNEMHTTNPIYCLLFLNFDFGWL